MGDLIKKETQSKTYRIGADDEVKIGDWYWVTDNEDREKGKKPILMCVSNVGSNHVAFEAMTSWGSQTHRVHFDNFFKDCEKEPNWKEKIEVKIEGLKHEVAQNLNLITEKAKSLHLMDVEASEETLPSTIIRSPEEYKQSLMKSQENFFPVIMKEIEKLNEELVGQMTNFILPEKFALKKLQENVSKIQDKILMVELYAGIKEELIQIKVGEPAPIKEPISIRQRLLYMDEESLLDYRAGGMDFKNLDEFDQWLIKPSILDKILPEKRAIVAFQIRRKDKDYGPARDLATAMIHFGWKSQNYNTYLYIRNGENVYRIATQIDFKPRLIPKHDEFTGELVKKDRWMREEDEVITVDHLDYDEFLLKRMTKIKGYNRILLVLQGLIDRSDVFQPMPVVKLASKEHIGTWLKVVRDEEMVLDSSTVLNWEEYRDQLNKTLKKGKVVVGAYGHIQKLMKEDGYGTEYSGRKFPWNYTMPPELCEVQSIKRDKSAVLVIWNWGEINGHYDDYGRWTCHTDRKRRAWIPMNEVLNATDYTVGDYKMFLCNRSTITQYLKWASLLLGAESFQQRGGVIPDEEEEERFYSSS